MSNLRVRLTAHDVVFVKVDLDMGTRVISFLEETASLPEPGTGFGSQFRLTGLGESIEGKSGDRLLDTFARLRVVIGNNHVGAQQPKRTDHSAQRFIVSPNAQGFIGRL